MEKIMQYIWLHRLWGSQPLRTVDGRKLQIIDTGQLNKDAGPDFSNAKIKIDDETWIGNIEIHIKASDWIRHGHDKDSLYDSVILHVVDVDDMPVIRNNGEIIPQLRLPCSNDFPKHYYNLVNNPDHELPCANNLTEIPDIIKSDWITSLGFERLITKQERIEQLLATHTNDWEEVSYIILARALGTGVNAEQFQRLAASSPLRFLRKHADSPLSIEAILFGQAGFLNDDINDSPYYRQLRDEYRFLMTKFGLRAPGDLQWKMSKMRPYSFPHRRVAVLASIINQDYNLISRITEIKTTDDAHELFKTQLSPFWETHYNFGSQAQASKTLGKSTVALMIINVVVPLLYAYGSIATSLKQGEKLQQRAIQLLEELPREKNNITEMFGRHGIKCNDAFTSQAVIQLKRNYCETRKCIYCRFGHKILTSKALRCHVVK